MEGTKVIHLIRPPPVQAQGGAQPGSQGPICGLDRLPRAGHSFRDIVPVTSHHSPPLSRSGDTRLTGRRIIHQDSISTFNKPSDPPIGGRLQVPGKTISRLFTGEPEYRAGKKCSAQGETMGNIQAECNYAMPRRHRPTAEECSGRAGTTSEYMMHNQTGIKTFEQKSGEEAVMCSSKRHYASAAPSATDAMIPHKKIAPFQRSDPFGSSGYPEDMRGPRPRHNTGPSVEEIFKPSLNVNTAKFSSDKASILHTAPPTRFDITGPIAIDARKQTQSTAAMMAEYHATRQAAANLKAREYVETSCY